jgi:hypothetical protein
MDEAELDVKDMLTSFEAEATKYGNLAQRISELTEKFHQANRVYEGLKTTKKEGEGGRMKMQLLNPNYSRWEEIVIHEDYRDEFLDLSIRMVIHQLREIKANIDYVMQVQK